MTEGPVAGNLIWLTPTLLSLLLYGLGQGVVKLYSAEVPPARYCLYFFFAKTVVYLSYFWYYAGANPFPLCSKRAVFFGILAYVFEGIGWVCYYESIVAGPITIVGTLSAAYAAPTVIFALIFLGETLLPVQYLGVFFVIAGCVGLSYAPPDPDAKVTSKRWIPLAITALVSWGIWQTLVKYTYTTFKMPDGTDMADTSMVVFNIIGAALTLGLYGLVFREKDHGGSWTAIRHSALPMGMMAGGDLGVLVATRTGEVSVVTTISGAYPLVTLGFASFILKERITLLQWACIGLILVGMVLSTKEMLAAFHLIG